MRLLWIPLVLTSLIVSILGCAAMPLIGRPQIQAVRPRITGIDFQGVDLAFDVDVHNPYPVPLQTPRFRYGIDIEGSSFLDSETTTRINLPARKVGAVTLPLRLSYSDLWRTYHVLADAPEATYTLHGALISSALGQSFELPVSHTGTFPILRPPTFSDVDVQLSHISLTKARIAVEAAMMNPNVFALGIEDLGYVLELGGVEVGGLTAATGGALDAGQTGRLSLSGYVSAASAVFSLIRGGTLGGARILPTGSIETPYGTVQFQR